MVAAAVPEGGAPQPPSPCANGHVWSNDFGDDWTPEVGTLCDCRGKAWGIPNAAGAPAVLEPSVEKLKEQFCENLRSVVLRRADGEYVALSHDALAGLVSTAAARMLNEFESAVRAALGAPEQKGK